MPQLKIKRKVLIFKTLAISKAVHLTLVKDVPSSTIAQFQKNTNKIFWGKRKILNQNILLSVTSMNKRTKKN